MREPPIKVRLLGSPLVALPILGLCGFTLYGVSQEPSAWPLGIAALVMGLFTMKAQDTANQYRRWRRAWDGMGGPSAPRSPMPRLASALVAVLVVGGFVLVDQGGVAGTAGGGQALVGLAVLGLLAAAIWMLVRRFRAGRSSRAKASAIAPVAIAVRGPLFPVPSLEAAYRSLPQHSQRVMQS